MTPTLRFPHDLLRLLYWLYFKPFTLRQTVQAMDPRLDEQLRLWEARDRLAESPALRELNRLVLVLLVLGPVAITAVVGLLLPLIGIPFVWLGAVNASGSFGSGGMLYALGFAAGSLVIYTLHWRSRRGTLWNFLAALPAAGLVYALTYAGLLAAGTDPGVAVGVAGGVAVGVAGGVAGGVAFGVAFGVAVGVAVGVAGGVAGGVAFGVAFGVAGGVAVGVAVGVAFGVAVGVAVGVAFGVALGVALGVAGGVAVGVAWIMGYYRLVFYLCEIPVQWFLARASRSRPSTALTTLPYSPLFWDELIWPPLLGLDTHLVAVALADRTRGAQAIAHTAASFRQGWAARAALLEVTARDVEGATDLATMAAIADLLAWLPATLPSELESFLPALRQVAERAQAALANDTAAGQLEQLDKARQEVTTLRQAQAWGRRARAGARLARALATWQAVLDKEAGELRRQVEGATIPQVYVAGSPLADQSRVFKGRRDLFLALERELTAQPELRPTLLLFGPRRSGKTSVLRQLPTRLGPDFVPVEIDLLAAVTSADAAGLLGSIANQVRDKALLTRRLTLPGLARAELAADPYATFFEWLAQAEARLDGRLILLNLDEYERLQEMVDDGRLDRRVFFWLRSLIQSHPQVLVLLSGSHTIEELPPAWSDTLVNVRLLRIGPLAEAEARELITAPVPGFPLVYEAAAIEAILAASGRQPYLVQAICRDLVNHLNEAGRRTATAADVEVALTAALQSAAVYPTELWGSPDTDDPQRAVLRLLAHQDGLVIGEADLLRQARAGPETLRRLAWRDAIELVEGGYRLRAGLVGRWLRERAPRFPSP